jgi:cell division initiation protein
MNPNKYLLYENESELDGISLRADDILQQKFPLKFRGYDVQDVDSFLEVVAKEMQKISRDNDRMQEELFKLRNDLGQYKQKEENIHAALVTVQKIADDVKKNAIEESGQIVANAQREAENIIREAQRKSEAISEEIELQKTRSESESKNIVNDARAEADRIKGEIERERTNYQENVNIEKNRIQDEINALIQRRMQFKISLKALIETHQKLLESES